MNQKIQPKSAENLFSIQNTEPTYDRIVKEPEREIISGVSRSQAFQLERKGLFPKRVKLSSHSVGWRLSDLLHWVETRQAV
jgi:predicted DNA-binding transcriptional regulator AlpA